MVRSLRGTGFLRILRISAYSLAVVVILLGVIEVAVRIAHPEIKLAGTS